MGTQRTNAATSWLGRLGIGKKPKVILSLFDYSGVWPSPYLEAGYHVVQVDLDHGQDVLDINAKWLRSLGKVHGVLAAPPCTHFSGSGAWKWEEKDADGRTDAAIKLIVKTMAIIKYLKPAFWAIENPVGRMGRLLHPLLTVKPSWYFQPHHYAALADNPLENQHTKKTGIWEGGVVKPTPETLGADYNLPPVNGSRMWRLPPTPDRARLRSKTPQGFARAFFMVNP
jgi:hypothetical protein